MKRISLIALSIITSFVLYSQNDKIDIKYVERPIEYEMYSAPDSLGNVIELEFPSLNNSIDVLNIPYPIILVHGLVGNSNTWDNFTSFLTNQCGYNYGGRFDFCLNYDSDNYEANLNFYDTPGADMALFVPTLIVAEYYKINFDVGINGSFHPDGNYYEVNSNQQAIKKQGKALRWAIYEILQLTGADKVILMGHSMGGLAAREYLQNPINWQPDGDHHVAKLVTTGTPHGGSNATMLGIGLNGLNEKLDATRDLRRSYAISEANGVYLFGGVESHSVMWNNVLFNYKNIDVNCNGVVGEYITGINQLNLFTNLSYSCIIGICSGCYLAGNTGDNDGIVKAYCADLKNYYSGLNVDRFYHYGSGDIQIHTDLPKQIQKNMQALDEPDEYNLAYQIGFDKIYKGFITTQALGGNSFDTDIYKFSVEEESSISISIRNIKIDNFLVRILDTSGNTIEEKENSNGSTTLELLAVIPKGSYYLEINGIPTSTSYKYAYRYTLTNLTDIVQLEKKTNISLYPVPAKAFFTIKDYSNNKEEILVNIISISGESILNVKFMDQIIISTEKMNIGMYFLKFKSKNDVITRKIIINK